MRIVLDACVPISLRHHIPGHEVVTTRYLRLSLMPDGDLIDALEDRYDVLLTCDRSFPWQQRFAGRRIAIVVMKAPTNKLAHLVKLVPAVIDVLKSIRPGEVCWVP